MIKRFDEMRMVFLFLQSFAAKKEPERFGEYDQSLCEYRHTGLFHRLGKIKWAITGSSVLLCTGV